jgi:SAM-dependent methyltransferase
MNQNSRSTLRQEGYTGTEITKVLSKPDFKSINYSDGVEVENALLETLKQTQDLSVLSPELMDACRDWVSSYHFSHTRANLLRPFEKSLKGTVLELGAGCGAITRYLGETAKDVVAVEGSILRCEINSERTRDLNNVTIVANELSDFETNLKFDTVVVVGVLEYAALFIDSPNPHLSFLRKAADLLEPDGKLLLAIENKFGLKYFAGSREDHTGAAMFGIEGRYTERGVRTFSRRELLKLFTDSGFLSVQIHSPLPDYKLVRGLVTESGLSDVNFNSGSLAGQLARFDPQVTNDVNFSLPAAWNEVGRGSLDSELANSFLIEARLTDDHSSILENNLGYWYGGNRSPEFLREKIFIKEKKSSNIFVTQSPLNGTRTSPEESRPFNQVLVTGEDYNLGELYSEHIERSLTQPSWSIKEFADHIRNFLDDCGDWCRVQGIKWPGKGEYSGRIDASLVDLTPRNVVRKNSESFKPFDLEWRYFEDIEISYLAYRCINDLLQTIIMFQPWQGAARDVSRLETIQACFSELGFSEKELKEAISTEVALQRQVSVADVSLEGYVDSLKQGFVFQSTDQELLTIKFWLDKQPLRALVGFLRAMLRMFRKFERR